jgi:hypothetical protein
MRTKRKAGSSERHLLLPDGGHRCSEPRPAMVFFSSHPVWVCLNGMLNAGWILTERGDVQ